MPRMPAETRIEENRTEERDQSIERNMTTSVHRSHYKVIKAQWKRLNPDNTESILRNDAPKSDFRKEVSIQDMTGLQGNGLEITQLSQKDQNR